MQPHARLFLVSTARSRPACPRAAPARACGLQSDIDEQAMHKEVSPQVVRPVATESVAEAYLALLKDRGIDYLYVGAGTDTAPVIEAYARAGQAGLQFPTAILAVHENLAVGMAHGYYMMTHRPQAVMLHVSVGAANAVCGLLNAARAQVPMLFTAGRTPLYEEGRLGSRSHEVHWAQEMFDQGGMVRELVKWDYELRDGINVDKIVDRALGISMAQPRGPVYLTLPREVLAQQIESACLSGPVTPPADPHADPAALATLAHALVQAEFPVIVCTGSGADPRTVALLAELADRFGFGVAENRPRYMNFPSSHPNHLGFDMAAVFGKADAFLFLDCDVPWIPSAFAPRAGAFVAQAGPDPLFSRYPLRSFRSDLAITATTRTLLQALIPALVAAGAQQTAPARQARMSHEALQAREAARRRADQDATREAPISKAFLSYCIDQVKPADAVIVNEYSAVREQICIDTPGTFFQLPSSGGLGWGLPAALGAQQAAPQRVVFAVLGDGSYLFANPAACHQACAMHGLPVLTVIFNNECWDGVQKAAQGMYPGAHADRHVAQHQAAPLSSLKPLPDFEMYAQASGGYGERVTRRQDLVPALLRALAVVRTERRQALLNVIGA
jgi:acetolactate synthase-1/2/3 large subunit